MALDARQRRFCEIHATGVSKAEACRQAGFAAAGARTQATRLLANVEVRAYLDQLLEAGAAAAGVDRDDGLTLLATIARDDKEKAVNRIAALRLMGDWLRWSDGAADDGLGAAQRFVVQDPGGPDE